MNRLSAANTFSQEERARQAAQEVTAVVKGAIGDKFDKRDSPRGYEDAADDGVEFLMVVIMIPIFVGVMFTPAVGVGLFLFVIAAKVAAMISENHDNDPEYQFNKAARKLERESRHLPSGPVKTGFEKFLGKAARCFTLAKVSQVKEEMASPERSEKERKRGERYALHALNTGASKWHWPDLSDLKAAFHKGQLSSPESYGAELADENQKLGGVSAAGRDDVFRNAA